MKPFVAIHIVLVMMMFTMLGRNVWVFNQRGAIYTIAHDYNVEVIEKHRGGEYGDLYESELLEDYLLSYDYSMFRFWVWNYDAFITDERLISYKNRK